MEIEGLIYPCGAWDGWGCLKIRIIHIDSVGLKSTNGQPNLPLQSKHIPIIIGTDGLTGMH